MTAPSHPAPTKPPRTRVLCVDDNSDVAAVLQMIVNSDPTLECVGCLASADSLVAEVRGRDPQPDVVIIDATMPGRCPMEAVAELAAACPAARAVFYSAHDDAAIIERARAAGARGWASKNGDPADLLRAVHRVADGEMAF